MRKLTFQQQHNAYNAAFLCVLIIFTPICNILFIFPHSISKIKRIPAKLSEINSHLYLNHHFSFELLWSKLFPLTDAYCRTQETYETKGQASERLRVKDYFSHKISNNKASIVSQQTLKLAAGANGRLTGLTAPPASRNSDDFSSHPLKLEII